MPTVSVIIPCYNQGEYLHEAVESVRSQSLKNLEIIIVNDGSDDETTPQICTALEGPGVKVLNTANQGLAAARNYGIAESKGQYILPLDADDKIGPNYIKEAATILNEEPDIAIVYCKAQLFGAVNTPWLLPEYSLEEMLKNNVIFCSALYRRSDWELVGGYDSGMIYGWEDYDFWLSLIEKGRKVLQLPEVHFFYRIDPGSMVRTKERWQKIEMFKRIYQRHTYFIGNNIEIWLKAVLEQNEPICISRLYVDEGKGIDDQSSIAIEVNRDTKVLIFALEKFTYRKEVRFDPVECPACIKIHSIELVGVKTKNLLDLGEISSNALFRDENLFMFETHDPQIYFNWTSIKLQETIEIRVVLDYISIKEQALRDIIKFAILVNDSGRKKSVLSRWFMPQQT